MTEHQCRGALAPEKPTRKGHGRSSFWLHDPEVVFGHMGVRSGMVFVDAGCGAGEYSLHAAGLVGDKGGVIALDRDALSVEALLHEAREKGLTNITGLVHDITRPLPLESGMADVVLLFTVLHIAAVRDKAGTMFREFRRVIRPGGLLAVIDCKKEEASFGPPRHLRLSEEEVEDAVLPCGFDKLSALDLGHTYLLCFRAR